MIRNLFTDTKGPCSQLVFDLPTKMPVANEWVERKTQDVQVPAGQVRGGEWRYWVGGGVVTEWTQSCRGDLQNFIGRKGRQSMGFSGGNWATEGRFRGAERRVTVRAR